MSDSQDSFVGKRFYDIDAARSGVMFVALMIHTGAVYCEKRVMVTNNADRSAVFTFFVEGLHLFISPTFFVVGGFFTALLMVRYGVPKFIVKRMLRAGVPLAFIALTFNLVENYMRYAHAGAVPVSFNGFTSYLGSPMFAEVWATEQWQLHAWFLVQLLLSFLAAVCVAVVIGVLSISLAPLQRLMDKVGRFMHGDAGFLITLAILPLLNIVVLWVCSFIPNAYETISVVGIGVSSVFRFLHYFTYFAFGALMFLSAGFYESLLKWRKVMVVMAVLAFCLQVYPEDYDVSPLGELFVLWLHHLMRWTLILFVLQFCHKQFAEKPTGATAVLSDASMTFFLMHHGLVYFIGSALVLISLPIFFEWLFLATTVSTLALLSHFFIVSNSKVFRFLVNGQTSWKRVPLKKTVL